MTERELQDWIAEGEDFFIEFKREIDSAIDIAAEVVAFANTEGGILLIGVDDDKSVCGVDDADSVERRLVGICRDSVIPAIVPEIEKAYVESLDKTVIIARIPKGSDKPYRTKTDHYYVRAGSTKRRTSKEELGRLFQGAGFVHYDVAPVPGTSLDTLDLHRVEKYFEQVHKLDIHRAEIGLERLLANAQILSEDGRATVGGILFFTERPADILFQASLMLARYAGDEVSDDLMRTECIEAPLPEAIDRTFEFVMNNIQSTTTLVGARRVEVHQYPAVVVKEAITNAVAHRNYSIAGSRIAIWIFDDHIEVKSPGRLPNTVTLDSIRFGTSFSRNQFIVRLLNNYGYIELLGQGVPMMIREMRKHAGREPEFVERGEQFVVTLHGKQIDW
ncbi:MAG: putative DNA binding domain-containing protein [Anaerolineales bacterium]|nr:putative DNA binding domain-containing protein [Anaerolineales bacterium]